MLPGRTLLCYLMVAGGGLPGPGYYWPGPACISTSAGMESEEDLEDPLAQPFSGPCHTVTLSHCPTVTLSHCHTVTLSYCHTVTLSYCHTVTLSHCHTVMSHKTPCSGRVIETLCWHSVAETWTDPVLSELCPEFLTQQRQITNFAKFSLSLLWTKVSGQPGSNVTRRMWYKTRLLWMKQLSRPALLI